MHIDHGALAAMKQIRRQFSFMQQDAKQRAARPVRSNAASESFAERDTRIAKERRKRINDALAELDEEYNAERNREIA